MDPLAPFITRCAPKAARVSSLVLTVFGDAARPRGERIAISRLARLLGHIGVVPGALRTTLSRLVRYGWITRERAGRNSFNQLSSGGEVAFANATNRICAAPEPGLPTRWSLIARGPKPALALAVGEAL